MTEKKSQRKFSEINQKNTK